MAYTAAFLRLVARALGNVAWEVAYVLRLVQLHEAILKEMKR